MKNLRLLLIVLFSIVLVSSVTSGASSNNKVRVSERTIENLMEGLRSDNMGLKISAAYYLGEYECSGAVIELLRVLKSDKREEARIAAALALYKLNDARGLFAVKQAIRFDKSERVKKICSNLYKEHLKIDKEIPSIYASF
jgi:hypothetical protein